MWVLFKLLVALVAFILRYARVSTKKPTGNLGQEPYFWITYKNKQGDILYSKVGIPFSFPALFSFHFENRHDGFWKKVGLSHEFQTGDLEFDQSIYVTSDNSGLHELLRESLEARQCIRNLLNLTAIGDLDSRRVRFDGTALWLESSDSFASVENVVKDLVGASVILASAKQHISSFWLDPFFYKTLVIESVLWSIGGYAIAEFIELMVQSQEYHLNKSRLLVLSLMAAAALLFACVSLVVTLLKGSSRAHRVILESKLILLVALPISAFSALSDLNRHLDLEPGVVEQLRVENLEKRRRRGRRGSISYSYHAHLRPAPGTLSPSLGEGRWIQLSSDQYQSAFGKGSAILEVAPGRLGVPWIRDLRFE